MNDRPFVSVIMPVYNAEKYLIDSIESVLKQSFRDLELILVNDCSKDSSAQICADYALKDKRVNFVNLNKNVGAGNARNAGIEKAKGLYLAFMDADDTLDLDLYEEAERASENGTTDMIVWGATECYFNKSGEINSRNIIKEKPCSLKDKTMIAKTALNLEKRTLLGYQWNKFYRRKIVEENHIRFEESVLYEDFFFTMCILTHVNSMAVIDSAGYYYNKRFDGSITTRFVPEYFDLSRRRVYTMYQFCQKQGILCEAREILGNIYLRYILSALMRNADKRSGMRRKDRISWINKVCNDKLYIHTAGECKANSKVLGLLQKALNNRSYVFCLLLGKSIYFVKVYGKALFVKAVQQKDSK